MNLLFYYFNLFINSSTSFINDFSLILYLVFEIFKVFTIPIFFITKIHHYYYNN